jgi:hypothetical protein
MALKEQLSLAEITRREVSRYAVDSDDVQLYSVLDDKHKTYAVNVVPTNEQERPAWVAVMARVVGDYVVIDEDRTDKPLVDALMANGDVPREKIILAYQGEALPDNGLK